MEGVGNNRFAPNGAVSRAMVVTMLYRLAGEPEVENASAFQDVPAGQWYTQAVAWVAGNGIAKGVTPDLFRPNDAATREQLVTFLYRYAEFSSMDTSAKADLTAFTDGASVSGFAGDAMAWAVGTGLVEGTGGNRLAPRATATRAQLAAVVYRLVK